MAKRVNRYRKSDPIEDFIPDTKKRSKSKKSKTQSEFKQFLKDGRAAKILGLFILMMALFISIACVSYLFNRNTDFSEVVNKSAYEVMTDKDLRVENALGRLGAIFSHVLVNQWFGISSAIIIYLLFGLSLNLLANKRIFKLLTNILYAIPIILIAATAFSFLNAADGFPWGGGIGQSLNSWLKGFAGIVGTVGILIFATLILLTIAYNLNFLGLKKWFISRKDDDGLTQEETAAVEGDFKHSHKEELTKKETESKKEAKAENKLSLELNNEIDATKEKTEELDPKPKTNKKTKVDEEDLELKIEEAVEEKVVSKIEHKGLDTDFDPTLDLSSYKFPGLDLLADHGGDKVMVDREALETNKDQIIETLSNYNIGIKSIKATVGPTVTLYEIVPKAGVRISKIKNLEDDIALSLAALGIRIIAPIPGKGTIGIEVPNENPATVSMKSVLASEKYQNTKFELPLALGKNIANEVFIADLAKMPHLLMAGATGQGKSVGINAILASLLYKKHPSQLKFVLVDPKKVELSIYSYIEKHFLARLPNEEDCIITDTTKVVHTLNALCIEMDDRYNLLKEANCRNLKEYNVKFVKRKLNPEKGHKFMPYIVLVIDEFADLIMTAGKEVEMPIARLAQLARAIGIHLIVATQRPSVNVITGIIKANFPARFAFRVSSKIDSRTILDGGGADQLIGRGDMLVKLGSDVTRLQCAFIDTPEVDELVKFISEQRGYPTAFELPEYVTDEDKALGGFSMSTADALFEDAAKLLVNAQSGSTSLIQRKMSLGYNRAGRIVDQLEAAGIVGPSRGSKPREVLFSDIMELEHFLNNLKETS